MRHTSERIPQKNYRELAGKKLFYYVADTLFKSKIFKKLIINTDSEKISALALERYSDWVVIHKRPEVLRGDLVSMNKIIEYDIKKIGNKYHFLQTHSTNPFLSETTIKAAIKKYEEKVKEGNYDSLFSVNAINSRLYDQQLRPINHESNKLIRTQDLKIVYEENSNLYIFSLDSFLSNGHRIGKSAFPFIMNSDKIESLDIDNSTEWDYAEKLIHGGLI